MRSIVETFKRRPGRVFLVALESKARSTGEVKDSLDELAELTDSAGGQLVAKGTQRLNTPVPGTFIGPGKALELAALCRKEDVNTVIFDDDLSPVQTRNLEAIFECKVLDRTSLILNLFAQRARTSEGKLQVELAQLQYSLPRLTGLWGHLSRQTGGIGVKGDGETQLEADRRRIHERIAKIGHELDTVRHQRKTRRDGRQRTHWPLVSIVGYTNAGKSTLLNTLTGASVLAEDKLFATLDPTTRRLHLATNQTVLLTDTVGFIRRLPHGLVKAFKATLEEVVEAELLLHVVDLNHPLVREHILSVNSVLAEIGTSNKCMLMVFNKIDCTGAADLLGQYLERFPNSVGVSAKTGEGIPALLTKLGSLLSSDRELVTLGIPHHETAVIARLHLTAQILERDYSGGSAKFEARIPRRLRSEFERFIEPKATVLSRTTV
jgi:GTPase